jgi:signal transduction histidine kinase/uncharacterized protein YlzI (FlbEa/FlbD family)
MAKRFAIRIQDRDGFERKESLGDVALLGRQRLCDIVLQDEMISRMHLRVECVGGTCWAEDLGSLHGTFVDGERIEKIRWEPSTVLTLADGAYRLLLVQERLQGSDSSIRAILSTARHLAGKYDLHLILQKSLNHLLRLSAQDRGFIMLPDPMDRDRLKVIVSRGMNGEAGEAGDAPHGDVCAANGTLLSMSSVQSVFDTGEPIWAPDLSSDESRRVQHPIMDLHLVAILCMPLLVRGKSIGVVYLDGQRKNLEPIDRSSFETIVGLCAVAIDRARMAEDGRRNKILATVGAAATSIAIEFCNALEAANSSVEALTDICRDEAAQIHLSQLGASLERLSSMSSKLLMFADTGPLEKTLVDMSRFLHGKLIEWRKKVKGSGTEIVGYGPECTARIDVQNFSSIVDYLVANSMDALADKGPGAKIELSWELAQDLLRIRLTDNGKGIPLDVLEGIFEPRFSTPSGEGEGGVGLASVKMHIEEHGGAIGIASEVGKGTTVSINLPAQMADKTEVLTSHGAADAKRGTAAAD